MAGGFVSTSLSSTEIYSTFKKEWNFGVPLPSARHFNSNGISVNNNVFLIGKKESKQKSQHAGLFEDILN